MESAGVTVKVLATASKYNRGLRVMYLSLGTSSVSQRMDRDHPGRVTSRVTICGHVAS